jgi:hypothetical protein
MIVTSQTKEYITDIIRASIAACVAHGLANAAFGAQNTTYAIEVVK